MIVKDSKDNTVAPPMKNSYAPVSARGSGEPVYNYNDAGGTDSSLPSPPPPPSYGAVQDPFPGYSPSNKSSRRRFCRAFVFALIFGVLLTAFIRSIIHLHLVHRYHKHWSLAKDYPEFDTGEAIQCIERQDWTSASAVFFNSQEEMSLDARPPFHSSTSFSLPSDADLLYLLSRGSLAQGSVDIKLASEPSVGEEAVTVDVHVWYWTRDALDRASICPLESHENGDHYGVGIYTPRNWPGASRRDRLHFEVVVQLPLGIYKAFETDYENFSLRLADLQGNVAFENIHLKTSNGRIHADSLEAHEGTAKSSNGPISGRYNVTNSLELITSNAGIDTLIDMNSENSHVTSLLLKTSNGHVHSSLSLHGPPLSSAFDVQALTSNAPAVIHVLTQPHSSPLTLEVRSSNSPVRATLSPAFEGPFTLRTSAFTAPVLRAGDGEIEDPSGEGRERSVQVSRQVRGTLEGKVWWGEWADEGKGWAHVSSSNSPVSLDLTSNPSW